MIPVKIRVTIPGRTPEEFDIEEPHQAMKAFDLYDWRAQWIEWKQQTENGASIRRPTLSTIFDNKSSFSIWAVDTDQFRILLFARSYKKLLGFISVPIVREWQTRKPISMEKGREILRSLLSIESEQVTDWLNEELCLVRGKPVSH